MQLCVVLRKGDIVKMDSGFSYDERDEAGELRFAKLNPVKILNEYFENPRIRNAAKQVWLGDWVLDCNTGKIVLVNDWTERLVVV